MQLLHREAKCQVANKAIGLQSPPSHVSSWSFLCSGTKRLYKGRLQRTVNCWNWQLKFLMLNCESGWMAGGEWMRLLLWWRRMGRNCLIQPKEPSPVIFLLHRCPWLTKAISPAIPVYNGLVFLFVLANFSMATFMDPGVFPRGNRKWVWWVPLLPPFSLIIFLVDF